MAKITIGGRAFELAPFRLGGLRKLPPIWIASMPRGDVRSREPARRWPRGRARVRARYVRSPGHRPPKIDPAACRLARGAAGIDDILELQQQFREVLIASGLAKKGEAQAVSEPAGAETVEPRPEPWRAARTRIIAELVAAGIEGGSKRRIEEEWTLIDYEEQRDYWDDCPPANITLGMIASALGIEIDGRAEPEYGSIDPEGWQVDC
jgi:hypothetical protein